MSDILLQVANFHCERDDRVLFKDVHFSLSGGEILQVVGHNGCGKTTLLRSLVGLSSYATGDLTWRGQPIADAMARYRTEVLFHGHLAGVKHLLSPRENLQWFVDIFCAGQGNVEAALQTIGLFGYEDVPCGALSAGQLRRVALARLQLSGAILWVLDEPFTAIDVHGIAMLQTMLQRHVSKGGAVLLTSHQAIDVPDVRSLNLEMFK
ncbi:MAG TPA: cytochrome c biogenesis heme-transporting ATPase CcmA [Pseudomonadales bacterium]|nr:cytochrome c biogenesis heme-transporting ATPase CcmA [Pseudomonadales bacterium]